MSFPRYPSYRDSGVEWLGQLPRDWRVLPLKAVASCNDEVLPESTASDTPIEYVEISGVEEGRGIVLTESVTFGTAPSRARRVVRHGDVLISTVRTYLRAIATVAYPPGNLIASTGFAAIRPRTVHAGFLGYLLHCEYLMSEVIARSVGISYPAINASELMRLKAPLPTPEEQRAIAAFLDRETAKIDALVEEQKRLIELLKEKRQAVISQAVTKGLDPNVRMKDSGVEWLGKVPANWGIGPLRRAFDAMEYGISDSLDSDGSIPVLRMGNIRDGQVLLNDLKYADSVDDHLLLQAGDLLFNRTNSLDQIGKVGLFVGSTSDAQVTFASYLVRLRANPSCLPEFFVFLLNCPGMLAEARANAIVAIGQCNLNPTRYGAFRIAIPPREEQLSIAEFLDRACAQLDELTAEAQEAISLLNERRSALISAAVTGKIDVRGLAPRPHGEASPPAHDESHDLQCG